MSACYGRYCPPNPGDAELCGQHSWYTSLDADPTGTRGYSGVYSEKSPDSKPLKGRLVGVSRLLRRRCPLKIFWTLPGIAKWALITLLIGFAAGFYLGSGAGQAGTGSPGSVIDQSMSLQYVPMPVQKFETPSADQTPHVLAGPAGR